MKVGLSTQSYAPLKVKKSDDILLTSQFYSRSTDFRLSVSSVQERNFLNPAGTLLVVGSVWVWLCLVRPW